MAKPNNNRYLFPALLIAFLLALWIQYPNLRDPYRVENDVRNMYLIHRYVDVSLFPYEQESFFLVPLGQHTLRIDPASPGYSLLLSLAATFMSPVLLTKLLVFPLTLAAAFFLYRLGQEFVSPATGLALVVIFVTTNLASGTSIGLVSGLHRTFGPPLILALLYYLHQRRYIVALFVVAALAFVYVPLLPVAGLTFLLALRRERWSDWLRQPPVLVVLLVLVIPVGWLVLRLAGRQLPRAIAGLTGILENPNSHIFFDPVYGQGGRFQLYYLFPLVGRMGLITSEELALQMMVLISVAILLFLVQKGRMRPLSPVCRDLFWASAIGYVLAWLAVLVTNSFLLYQPSRFTTTSLFVLLVILVGINLEGGLNAVLTWLRRDGGRFAVLVPAGAVVTMALLLPNPNYDAEQSNILRISLLALGAALLGLFALQWRRNKDVTSGSVVDSSRLLVVVTIGLLPVTLLYLHIRRPLFVNPTAEERALYDYLATLPRDALIAGDPCMLDSVPYFSQRSVLLRCKQFDQPDEKLAVDALLAYYADSEDDLISFCRSYSVEYLVVDERSFERVAAGEQIYFHEPYHSLVAPSIAARERFVLGSTPTDRRLFSAGDLSVVRCPTEPLAVKAP
jgi:hypothetical protein